MSIQALRLRVRQPSAHYRDPKVFQNDYISTVDLPSRTTIIGMITYLCGKRLKSKINIGVVGSHESKDIEFSRGESVEYWKKYRGLKKGKDAWKYLNNGEIEDYYKDHIAKNTILNYEVLKEVKLSIYFTCEDTEEFQMVYESLNSPGRYMNLGRKEDFIIPEVKGEFVQIVDLKEKHIDNIRDAIKNNIKIKNSYIKVDLKQNEKYEKIINQGSLICLPRTYKDINTDKKDRVMISQHYIYIREEGIYPENIDVNIYEGKDDKEVFTWL